MWHSSVFGTKQVEMLCELRISRVYDVCLFLQYCWIKDSGVQMQGPLTLWVRIPIKSRCIRIQHYVIKFVTNKIDHHDIAEILLKVALKTIKITLIFKCRFPSSIPMIFTIHVACDLVLVYRALYWKLVFICWIPIFVVFIVTIKPRNLAINH
jgi:hypothetical protein